MAGSELAVDDAALFLSPRLSVWVGGAGVFFAARIWTARGHFPAVSKLHNINHYCITSGGEVSVSVSIIVSTQTTDMTLEEEFYKHI